MNVTIELPSGLCVLLSDDSRHYFGGYYHVRISACCLVTVVRDYFETDSDFETAQSVLGPVVRFERVLEKMAVPADDVATVQNQLIAAFNLTTRHYLESSGFAKAFVRNELQKRSKKSLKYMVSQV